MNREDLYKILGLDKNASREDIKKAYHRLAHIHHPDKKSDEDASDYIKIREAFETLADEIRRKESDEKDGDSVRVNIRKSSSTEGRRNVRRSRFKEHDFRDHDELIDMIFREFFGNTWRSASPKGPNHIHYDDLII